MKFSFPFAAKTVARKQLVAAVAGLTALGAVWGGAAYADPAQDNVANFNELSKQAQQLIETVQSVQLDLDKKLQVQSQAERKHADDLAALDAAKAQLAPYQAALDSLAAAFYMGGRADGMNAIFTAASPQSFIDRLSIQRVMTAQMADQLRGFREATQRAEALARWVALPGTPAAVAP